MSVWKCIATSAAVLMFLAGNLQAQGQPWNNLGLIDIQAGEDFGDAEYRGRAISVGQLVGIDPDDGTMITGTVYLLPLMARSLYAAGVVDAGYFVGDGSQLENLDAQSLQGTISPTAMPAAGIWDASGLNIANARLSGDLQVEGEELVIVSNLRVQGSISGDGSALDNIAAGNDGDLQFNSAGRLAASNNIFVHEGTGRLVLRSVDGNLLHVYREGVVDDGNLVFVLRDSGDTVELVMRRDGEDTLRLGGDGSITAENLNVGSLSVGSGPSSGWFIPEAGDLSMGEFTDGN